MISTRAKHMFRLGLALVSASTAIAVSAPAQITTFVEDFTTTAYKDAVNTTAVWDTVAGEIRLPEFVIAETGYHDSAGTARAAVIAYKYVFIADGAGGLVIVDVGDLSAPVLTGSCTTSGFAADVALSGDHAYLATVGGLEVVDIADLTSPAYAGAYATTGPATGVAVDGDRAYVAAGSEGLVVLDITAPETPAPLGSYPSPMDDAVDVALDGDLAYVATTAGLDIFDVAGTTPVLLGSYAAGAAEAVAVEGNLAYLAAGAGGLVIVDVSTPATPVFAGSLATAGSARGLVVDGDFVYVADGGAGFTVVDARNPGAPVLVETFDTAGDARGVTFAGVWAFVADGGDGLRILEMRDSMNPVLAGSCAITAWGTDAALAGDHLYVTVGDAGVEVLDVGVPTAPSTAGAFDLAAGLDEALAIEIAGDRAYVAWSDTGLVVLDIGDPTAPVWLGGYDGSTMSATALAVAGNYVYVARETDLEIIDVSDPTTPSLAATYGLDSADVVHDVAVAGDYAYLACDTDVVQVVDISNPALPVLVVTYPMSGLDEIRAIDVEGDCALVSSVWSGVDVIYVLDITDPTTPGLESLCAGTGLPTDVVTRGFFVAASSAGEYDIEGFFDFFDLRDPNDWFAHRTYRSGTAARAIEVAGDYVYLVGEGGLEIVRAYNRTCVSDLNVVQSLPIGYDIAAVRMTTTQTDSITWQVGKSSISLWNASITPGVWTPLSTYIDTLSWRSTHILSSEDATAVCSRIEFEFKYSPATIDSIVDVPGDQGGWARVHFTRSGRDFETASVRVNDYIVWRRIDGGAATSGGELPVDDSGPSPDYLALFPALPLVEQNGRWCLDRTAKSAPGGFPPGDWEILGSFPALSIENYTYLAPTLGDDPLWSVHVVTAHADAEFWVSEPDSGTSLDNLAPGVPMGVTADYGATGVDLDWDDAPEPDFQYYRVYRSLDEGFVPAPEYLVHETASSAWTDPTAAPWDYHYMITTLDHAGNESEAGSPGSVSGVHEGAVPIRTALIGAFPNPFNPMTTIRYVLTATQIVHLRVYDVSGRLIRTLVADEKVPAGHHEVVWTGCDEANRRVASGVYFYRLDAGEFKQTKCMMMVK